MIPAHYRYNTLAPFGSLLDEFFGELMSERRPEHGFRPLMDLKEDDENYYAQLELPGLSKEDVKISIENNILRVYGEKKQEQVKEKQEHRRVERSHGVFERCFRLPQEIEDAGIRADMENGILRITIPKTQKAEPVQITIN